VSKSWSRKVSGHFWTKESGMTSMLILLCVSNFIVIPFFTQRHSLSFLIRIFWFVLIMAGITTLSRSRSRMRIFSVIPGLIVLVTVIRFIWDNQILDYFDFIIDLSVFSLLIGMVLVKVFESGQVTIHRVVGAIVVYMLIGNIWAIMFQFINVHLPGSLQVPAFYDDPGASPATFLYFSYTTLTTTGYGEILPTHSLTRTLVTIEQLIGVLYPVVLLGRLVSLVVGKTDTSASDQTKKNPDSQ
jgi:hypothetical protein